MWLAPVPRKDGEAIPPGPYDFIYRRLFSERSSATELRLYDLFRDESTEVFVKGKIDEGSMPALILTSFILIVSRGSDCPDSDSVSAIKRTRYAATGFNSFNLKYASGKKLKESFMILRFSSRKL